MNAPMTCPRRLSHYCLKCIQWKLHQISLYLKYYITKLPSNRLKWIRHVTITIYYVVHSDKHLFTKGRAFLSLLINDWILQITYTLHLSASCCCTTSLDAAMVFASVLRNVSHGGQLIVTINWEGEMNTVPDFSIPTKVFIHTDYSLCTSSWDELSG